MKTVLLSAAAAIILGLFTHALLAATVGTSPLLLRPTGLSDNAGQPNPRAHLGPIARAFGRGATASASSPAKL